MTMREKTRRIEREKENGNGKIQDFMTSIYMIAFIVICTWELVNRNDSDEIWLSITIILASIIGLSGMGLKSRKLLITFLSYHLLMTLMMAFGMVFLIAMLFTEEGMEVIRETANKSFKLEDESWSMSLFYIMLFALMGMKLFVHQNVKKKIKNII